MLFIVKISETLLKVFLVRFSVFYVYFVNMLFYCVILEFGKNLFKVRIFLFCGNWRNSKFNIIKGK